MTLFKPELLPVENKEIPHPWAHRIKDNYSHRIKYVHNSVHNPIYPKDKEIDRQNVDRIRFTIIGDRVTKEFTYSVNLVQGLHKYRKKVFDCPLIKGITTIEWPSIWRDLKIRYGGIAFCLRSNVAVLINDKLLGGDKELKHLIETKYVYHLCLDYYKEGIAEFAKFIKSAGRSCAYMHIAIDDEHIGTLIFMLYSDILPYTSENFLRLCTSTKGGYSGTPIHRIVKDGWIQGGGFALKDTELDCENFIIPHDRRGVLCMANNGRHIDCSTQFFVLLQPAPWMASKYVAFGQLIEGEKTLKKIETVPTWYESPISKIIIYKAGIFNMECHDIMINKNTYEHYNNHFEDLIALGELMWEIILERVFLTCQLREIARLHEQYGEGSQFVTEEAISVRDSASVKRKEEIEKQLLNQSFKLDTSRRINTAAVSVAENNDFDVDEYQYEYETEEDYKPQSTPHPASSLGIKPEKPYLIPLTDVPYPGEISSDFNLRRFLQGDYCLELDLKKDAPRQVLKEHLAFPPTMFDLYASPTGSEDSLDSNDEMEIKQYFKEQGEGVSFACSAVKNIARMGKTNIFDTGKRTDDALRRFRLACMDYRSRDRDKKVSISAPNFETQHKIKRRQTGFVRPEDLEKVHVYHKLSEHMSDEDEVDPNSGAARKVRIDPSTKGDTAPRPVRRPTGYARRRSDVMGSETDTRQSVLIRLYDEVQQDDEELPTLKDYRPVSEVRRKSTLLTYSPTTLIKSDESQRRKSFRQSITIERDSFENIMNIQHGKSVTRKISSDYINTIDQIEQKHDDSIRSVEYARTRPAITVNEYQKKNKKYQEEIINKVSANNLKVAKKPSKGPKRDAKGGLRLPGDSPLYSMVDMKDQ